MITCMLDTNICIYIIKKKPLYVFDHFKSIQSGEIGISSITLAELEFGVYKSSQVEKNQNALYNFLLPLDVVSFDDMAAKEYGILRSRLEKSGSPVGSLDMLIAAHAISLKATLVTNNIKEFFPTLYFLTL